MNSSKKRIVHLSKDKTYWANIADQTEDTATTMSIEFSHADTTCAWYATCGMLYYDEIGLITSRWTYHAKFERPEHGVLWLAAMLDFSVDDIVDLMWIEYEKREDDENA